MSPFIAALGYQTPLFPKLEEDITVPSVPNHCWKFQCAWSFAQGTQVFRRLKNHRNNFSKSYKWPPYWIWWGIYPCTSLRSHLCPLWLRLNFCYAKCQYTYNNFTSSPESSCFIVLQIFLGPSGSYCSDPVWCQLLILGQEILGS